MLLSEEGDTLGLGVAQTKVEVKGLNLTEPHLSAALSAGLHPADM